MLTAVIALAVFILIVQAVLDAVQEDWGRELTLRFLVVDVVCIGAVKKRKQLSARSKQTAANFRAKMSAARIDGTHSSVFSSPSTSAVPKNRHIVWRTARGLIRGTLAGVSLAQGKTLAAITYSMPRTVGATALVTRMQNGRRHSRPRHARPASGPAPLPGNPPGAPGGAGTPLQGAAAERHLGRPAQADIPATSRRPHASGWLTAPDRIRCPYLAPPHRSRRHLVDHIHDWHARCRPDEPSPSARPGPACRLAPYPAGGHTTEPIREGAGRSGSWLGGAGLRKDRRDATATPPGTGTTAPP
ncbi:hypothetical protein ACFU8W_50555 [Streptomyces sp. NPDC057565]|uniref:hypothetical protein n=1 Tax=Streptomyces sp. NPDC057565 TaxID=3346169 RepID=UPI00369C24F2